MEFFFCTNLKFHVALVFYALLICLFIVSDDETTLYHDPPLVYDIATDPSESSPIPSDQFPQDLLSTVTSLLEEHLNNRTDKGVSQFDHPFLPYYFPCANMVTCRQKNDELDDFSELLDNKELEN